MIIRRWAVRAAAVGAVLVTLPVPGYAAQDDGLAIVVPVLAPMMPGQQGWVSAMWVASADVCDVQVTASGAGLSIGYPANTATFSSLYTNSALAAGNMDYTAFNVGVGAGTAVAVPVTLTVSYRLLPPGQVRKDDDLKVKKVTCSGPKGDATVSVVLPVVPSIAAAVVQKTTAVNVPKATPTWANIVFRGTRPGLADFRVTLTPPPGLTLTYPGQGTSAGLHTASTLPVGGDDHVAVRLDTSGLAPGDYKVPVRATYTGGSYDGTLTVVVT